MIEFDPPIKSDIEVVDSLESNDAQSALSANQGAVIDQRIDDLRTDVGNTDTDFATLFNTMLT